MLNVGSCAVSSFCWDSASAAALRSHFAKRTKGATSKEMASDCFSGSMQLGNSHRDVCRRSATEQFSRDSARSCDVTCDWPIADHVARNPLRQIRGLWQQSAGLIKSNDPYADGAEPRQPLFQLSHCTPCCLTPM
jgi:hypothetical protein